MLNRQRAASNLHAANWWSVRSRVRAFSSFRCILRTFNSIVKMLTKEDKTLIKKEFFVHSRSQQKTTEKFISNYLFEVLRALARSVEWSGMSGFDSPGSVPGPPQRQRSQKCASCADVHYRVPVSYTHLTLPTILRV